MHVKKIMHPFHGFVKAIFSQLNMFLMELQTLKFVFCLWKSHETSVCKFVTTHSDRQLESSASAGVDQWLH